MALALTVENTEGSREQRLFSSFFVPILLSSRAPELPSVIYTVRPVKLNLELARQVTEQFGEINFRELPSVIFTPVKDETDNGIRFLGSQEPISNAPVSLNSYQLLKQGYWLNAQRSEGENLSSLMDIVVMDRDRSAGAKSFQMFDRKFVEFDMDEEMQEKWELFSTLHRDKDYQALSQRIFEETGLNLFEMAQALTHIYADPRIVDPAEARAGTVEEYVQTKLHVDPQVLNTLILLASPMWRENWQRINSEPHLLPAPVIKKGMRIADIPDFTRQQLFLDVQEQMAAHAQDSAIALSVIDELALKYGLSRTNLTAITKDWPADFREQWVATLKSQASLRNPLRVIDQETTQSIIDQVQQEMRALFDGRDVRVTSDKELAELIGVKGTTTISAMLRRAFSQEELEARHKRIMEQAYHEKSENFSETLEIRKSNLRSFLQPMMQYIGRIDKIEESIMRLPSNAQLAKMFNLESGTVADIIDTEFDDTLIVKRRLLIRSQGNLDRKIEPIVKDEIRSMVVEQLDRIRSGLEDPLQVLTYQELVDFIKSKYPDKKISVPMMGSVLGEVLEPDELDLRTRLSGERKRVVASKEVVDPEIKQGLVTFVREQLRALTAGEIRTSQLYSTAQLQELFGISRGLLSQVLRANLTDSELEQRRVVVLKQQVTRRIEYEGRAFSSASEATVFTFLRDTAGLRIDDQNMQRVFTNGEGDKIVVDFVIETDQGPIAVDYHPGYMEMVGDVIDGKNPYQRAKILGQKFKVKNTWKLPADLSDTKIQIDGNRPRVKRTSDIEPEFIKKTSKISTRRTLPSEYKTIEDIQRGFLRQREKELMDRYRERRRGFIPQDLDYVVLTSPEDLYDFLKKMKGDAFTYGRFEFLRLFNNRAAGIRKQS